MAPQTDTQAMQEVRLGDTSKLALIFERHHIALYNYFIRLSGNRTMSEDMVQEVFFRILKYRYTYRGEGEFLPWMYHIARNVHHDFGKRWNRESPLDDDRHDEADDAPAPSERIEQHQDIAMLQAALAQLPDEKKEVLILSRFHDMKYKAIAELLGCSVEAVKVRVHRAMNDLRKAYFQLSGDSSV